MQEYIVKGSKITAIADAIREKLCKSESIKFNDMPQKIQEIDSNGIYDALQVCGEQVLLDNAVLGEELQNIYASIDRKVPEGEQTFIGVTIVQGNLFSPNLISAYLDGDAYKFTQDTEIKFALPRGKYYIGAKAKGTNLPSIKINYSSGDSKKVFVQAVSDFENLSLFTDGREIKSITFGQGSFKDIFVFAGKEVREYIPYGSRFAVSDIGDFRYHIDTPIYIEEKPMLTDKSILVTSTERIKVKYTANTKKQIFDDGYNLCGDADYNNFWDIYQDFGNRTNYDNAFARGWNELFLIPKYDISPESARYMFANSAITDLEIFAKHGTSIDFSECEDCTGIFEGTNFTSLSALDFSNSDSIDYAFAGCRNLKTISSITINQNTTFNSTFADCDKLESITFSGTIGQNIDISTCLKITTASILSIVSALQDHPSIESPTFKLGTNISKLNTVQRSLIVRKGWAIA